MNWQNKIQSKIFSKNSDLKDIITSWRDAGNKIVFTNGCFDILHLGHLDYLTKAAELGDKLVIGVNTDASVSKLKGDNRPVIDETTRVRKLASMAFIDAVILFNEETPLELIKGISPNVLVKGGDYSLEGVVGADHVLQTGGAVKLIDFLPGHSTSSIIDKIRK